MQKGKLIQNVSHDVPPPDGEYAALGVLPGAEIPVHPHQNIGLVHEWVKDCVQNHSQCQVSNPVLLPKRVIAIGTIQRPLLHLHESCNDIANYAALSHRWSTEQLLTTTKDTLEYRKKQIEWKSLSKTFQDAITVARDLGLRYLWIDSLCIIQDDAEDWQIESSKMATIYEMAYVTIAANRTTGGLLRSNARRSARSANIQALDGTGNVVDLLVRSPMDHANFYVSALEGGMQEETAYPLLQRAWCFQERLLATRILQFTDAEIIFECKSGQHCECGSINHARTTPIKSMFGTVLGETFQPANLAEDVWNGWILVLRSYVTKDLTVATDILPALAGLAAQIQCSELGRYIAGLWTGEIAKGLFWFADVLATKKTSVKTAPTFSWAALAGVANIKELTWPYMDSHDNSQQKFKVLDVQCSVAGLNPYGIVSTACVKLSGYGGIVTLKFGKRVRGDNAVMKLGTREQPAMVFMDTIPQATSGFEDEFTCFFGFTWTEDDYTKRPPVVKHCVSALLLKLLSEPGAYQRVGCIPQLNNDPSWLRDAQEMNVSIV